MRSESAPLGMEDIKVKGTDIKERKGNCTNPGPASDFSYTYVIHIPVEYNIGRRPYMETLFCRQWLRAWYQFQSTEVNESTLAE